MTTVFLAYDDEDELLGIFSTRAKAETWVDQWHCVPGDYIMERPLDFDTCPLCSSDSRARRQGVNGGICTDAWHNPDTETTMPDPTNEAEALAIVQRMVKIGCPTYRDNSGGRSRDGCAICIFCDANIELADPHAEDCLWLKALEVVRQAEEAGKS